MKFADIIPQQGTIAIIGGGGKTGLMERLEAELYETSRVALCTVTTRLGRGQLPHLARVDAESQAEAEAAARRATAGERVLLAGPYSSDEKLGGLPLEWLPAVEAALPPEAALLIEADGSAGRPLKAHGEHEPVLPPGPHFLVAVLGLSALTLPWAEAVHRPELLARHITPPPEGQSLSPAEVAAFVRRAWAGLQPNLIFLNQADLLTGNDLYRGHELAQRLRAAGFAVVMGSLQEGYLAA